VAALKEKLAGLHASDAYQPFALVRSKLPAHAFKDKVVRAVNEHQVTIISGETGCGKSPTSSIPSKTDSFLSCF
jgi:ATP-dependent RNA helicase DHX57